MKRTKRLLFTLLTLCLLSGLLPASAGAVSAHSHPICGASCSHPEGHGAENYTALTADMINTGETTDYTLAPGNYYLSEDITTARRINAFGEIDLCLNGHTITCTENANMMVVSDAALYICDCQGGGGISDGRTASKNFLYINGAVTLFGGTFTGTKVLYVSGNSGTLTVDGATIKASSTALNAQSGTTVHIKSGELTTSNAFYTVQVFSPNFTMTGGKVVNTRANGEGVSFSGGGGGTISGGTIQATGIGGVGVSVGAEYNVALSGAPVIEGKGADIQFSAVTGAAGVLTVGENLTGTFKVSHLYKDGSGEFSIAETKPFLFTTATARDDSEHFTSANPKIALRDMEDKATGKHTLELYRKHAWYTSWQNNATHHWRDCANADCTITDNAQKEEYAAHNVVDDPAVPATCVKAGKTAGSHCSKCKYVIIPQQTIPATGEHTYPGYEKNEAQHWQKCSVCQSETSKTAHKAVTDKAEDATCTTDGKTEGSHCSVCGYVIIPQEAIPAGHTWGKWTLQADGQTVKRVCGADPSHTESKSLAITLDKSSYVYSGGENKPTVTVKVGGATLTQGTDYTVSYKDNVNTGTAAVTVTGKGSYAGSADKSFTIKAKTLTATAARATDRAYDGATSVTVTAVTLDGVVDGDDVAVNTTGLKGTVSSPDASDTPYETVSLNGLTLTGAEAGNYTLAQVNVTLPTSVTISKATPPPATPGSFNIANSLEKEYNYLLSLLCPQLNQPDVTADRKDWGERSYTIKSVEFTGDGYYIGGARIDKAQESGQYINRLYLPIAFNDTDDEGQVGTVEIEVSSVNYASFTNTIQIMARNKTSVTFGGVSVPDKTYDGRPYAYEGRLTVSAGNVYVTDADVEITYVGRGETAYSEWETPPTNAGTFAMVVRIADTDEKYIGRRSYNFTIRKAPGQGSVAMSGFSCAETPSIPVPVSATNGIDRVSYGYKARNAADETYSSTKPTTSGEYTVRAVFPAVLNYTQATATADFTVSHAYASEWSADRTGHWYECPCGDRRGETAHVYDNAEDTDCNICGYVRTITPPDQGEVKGEVEVKPGTGTPAVTTDAEVLKDLAGEVQEGQNVTVKFTVEKRDEPEDKDEIVELVTGKKDDVLYLDLSLLRQVNDEEPEAITNTGDKVLEIVVPYDFTGKKDVSVYRKHGGEQAEALCSLAARPEGGYADGSFFADSGHGKVYIYASKFSIYAIGYTAQTSEPSHSGGGSDNSDDYYTLTAEAGEGGGISPKGKVTVRRGTRKTFTITPGEGYEITDVLVDGKSVGVVTKYTFEKIATSHTIKAVFRKTVPGAAGCARDDTCLISKFTDAAPKTWYHDGVHYCLEKELMVGLSETTFAPGMETSRAMIATVLWRLSDSPETGVEASFPDCEADGWYTQAVAWCAEAGVVKGYDNGSFGPGDSITREQLALMLWRYAKLRGQDVSVGENADLLSYQDFDQAGQWAVPALQWAVGSGVVNGKDGNRLDPKGLASRAEAAAMLQRFCEM